MDFFVLGGSAKRRRFNPANIGGLAAWYRAGAGCWQDAERTIPAIADNDPVAVLDDLSGNGRHLAQATAEKRPLLKTGARNGLPGLWFDGSNDDLGCAGSWMGDDSGASLIGVFQWAGGASFPDYNGIFGNTTSDAKQICATWNSTELYGGVYRINGALTKDFTPLADYKIVALDLAYPSTPFGGLVLGWEPWTASRHWHGHGLEFLHYTKVLTAEERAQVFPYLAARYAITLA